MASTISEQALLNAVRASLDLPMSFTKLTAYTAGNMANGSFVPKLPFGPEAVSSFDLGPTLSLSSGVSQIQYSDANTAAALAKLNERLGYETLDRYFREGVNLVLLQALLVETVEIIEPLADVLMEEQRLLCRAPSNPQLSAACEELRIIKTECPGRNSVMAGPIRLEKGHRYYAITNRARTKCEFLGFVEFQISILLSGYIADIVTEPTFKKFETAEKKLVAVPGTRQSNVVSFQVPRVQSELLEQFKKLKADKVANRSPIRFGYRSPKSLLAFLGELIALQNNSKDMYVPSVPTFDGGRMIVFKVTQGCAPTEEVGLVVEGPYGERYCVSRPEYGSPTRDQTLRVLAVAGELVNAAISEKDIPAPASVIVQAIQ